MAEQAEVSLVEKIRIEVIDALETNIGALTDSGAEEVTEKMMILVAVKLVEEATEEQIEKAFRTALDGE